MYRGVTSGSLVDGSSQKLAISDIHAKIDDNGNLIFTFDVDGFKSGTGFSIPANGSYNVSVDSGTWWGSDSFSLTGSHTNSGYKFNNTITISSTGYAKSLLVEGKSIYNGNSKYYGLIGGGTVGDINNGKCYFDKQDEDKDYGTINNTFNVEQLDVLFLDAFGEQILGNSLSGVGEDYYYNSVKLALAYDEDNNSLTVVGKIEITWEDMTDMAKVNLNELKYRRICDNLTIDSDTFKSMLTKNGDTYTFVYPFKLGFNGTIYYSEDSSYKLTFKLTKNGDFPSDDEIESFVAKERELIPLLLASDPYSIYGSYKVNNCTGYVGTESSNNTNSWVNKSYGLTIKNAWFTLYNVGSLTVNFEVAGYEWNGTDLGYNGTVNFIKHWKNDGENLWWKSVDSDGYGYFEYSKDDGKYNVTVRDNGDGSLEVTHTIISSYSDSSTIYESASFTCDFVKISDTKIIE